MKRYLCLTPEIKMLSKYMFFRALVIKFIGESIYTLKYRFFFLIFIVFVICFPGMAQQSPRKYSALKTEIPLKIDGQAQEAAWQNAAWSQEHIDIEGEKAPLYKTRIKMLWDDDYLYFFALMEEPHVWGTLKKRDTVIFYNNDFEIFIDPDGDTHNYMEFEMNALNTVWDLFLTKPYRNHGKVLDSWDIQGLKTAVHIDGTLNDPRDIDSGWSVEIAMPWKVLTETSNSNEPPKNQTWRLNFSRVNWQYDLNDGRYSRKKDGDGKFLPEYNWVWSPQGVINMHEPEHWGYVHFSEKSFGKVDFEIPKDDYIKWNLYERARKLWNAEKEQTLKPKKAQLEEVFEVSGKSIVPRFEEYSSGWSISAKSPFSNKTLWVREDGKFLGYD